MNRQEAYGKLDGVLDEFQAAKFALRQTGEAYREDPHVNQAGRRQQVTLHHLETCTGNLQITYVLRVFAEFEGVLRHYWLHARQRNTKPPMRDLMNSVAAYCFMNNDDTHDAHEVREYRNDVIHEHLEDPRFDLQTCRSRLARFLRWLPKQW